jgi:hypothetical protein
LDDMARGCFQARRKHSAGHSPMAAMAFPKYRE